MTENKEWIGVDLDGTLAVHDRYGADYHPLYIGEPIEPMVERVKAWIADGKKVKILTARANARDYFTENPTEAELNVMKYHEAIGAIKSWAIKHIGYELEVTAAKDKWMTELWDDRCVQVNRNTGEVVAAAQLG